MKRKPNVSEPEGLDGDWKDGAGALTLHAASAFCIDPNDGPYRSVAEGELDINDAEEPPSSHSPPAYQEAPPGALSLKPTNQQWGGHAGAILSHRVHEYMSMAAVLSWNGCKGLIGPSDKVRDLDLDLYSTTRHEWLYVSLSNADNNEGFDVLIPSGWEGDFEAYVIYDPVLYDGVGCSNSTKERYAFATSSGAF